jgi:menaquinone-dependent protoporphyrinogen IX oxidase
MRIAVISAPAQRKKPPEYVQALAKGMTMMGHQVDIIDAWTEDGFKLPGYQYVAVTAEPLSFFSGKIPPIITKILSAGSTLVGKKSAAFIKKSGLFSNRALSNLMKEMEKEGMMINWSDILFNSPHAQEMGKRIGA